MEKRILSLLLAFLMVITVLPVPTHAEGGNPDPKCNCHDGYDSAAGHEATCPLYTCPVCGKSDCYDPNCVVEEEQPADYNDHVGKYVKLNPEIQTFSVYSKDTGHTETYLHEDFAENTILRIAEWMIRNDTLWYRVEFYSGSIVESSYTVSFPEYPWFQQLENALMFVETCPTCDKPDCSTDHTGTEPTTPSEPEESCDCCDSCTGEEGCECSCGECTFCEKVEEPTRPADEPLEDEETGIKISGEGIPADAQLSVSVPDIEVGENAGIYDIKILREDGSEWQPIDEGKTVTISIPVNANVQYVDVYHYIDYSPDIDGDEIFAEALSGDGGIFDACVDAYESAKESPDHIAIEKYQKVHVSNGKVEIKTNSFSVYYYDAGIYGDSDGNTDSINFENGNSDEGKNYFVTRGTVIKTTKGWMITGSWEHPTEFSRSDNNFTVQDSAALYHTYEITLDAGRILGSSTIYFTVMPELVLLFEHNINNADVTVTLPEGISGKFMGNSDTHNPSAGQYAALNYTLSAPTVAGEGYTFSHWYVKHHPTKTFAANQQIFLSNSTLEVMLDDNIATYEVTLVAKFDPTVYTLTYNTDGGSLPTGVNTTMSYTIEDTLTLPTPTKKDYAFLGWKVTSANGNWTTDSGFAGESAVQDKYGNVTLTAQWAEISDVTYQVQHYLQDINLNTDISAYQLAYTDTMAGKPDALTEAVAKNLRGFTAQQFEQVEISENNDTVVKIYYNRNIYTMSFDTIGGTAVQPITQAYGTDVSAPGQPQKTGYNFVGWYSADKPTELYSITTMPAEDITLYAKWTIKKPTLTFYEDSTCTKVLFTIYGEYGSTVEYPGDPVRNGYEFKGWNKAIPATIPENDDSFYAAWDILSYQISFDEDGGNSITDVIYQYGASVTKLPTTTRTGYIFEGWGYLVGETYQKVTDNQGNLLFMYTMPSQNIDVKALWSLITYNISYELDGGVVEEGNPATYTVEDTFTLTAPTKEGYEFMGWATDSDALSGDKELTIEKGTTGDKTYYATWKSTCSNLTINIAGRNTGKAYVFVVKNSKGVEVSRVVLHEDKTSITIAKLTADTYTVTPLDNWVWRQNVIGTNNGSISLMNGNAEITFTCTFIDTLTRWLNGYGYGKGAKE